MVADISHGHFIELLVFIWVDLPANEGEISQTYFVFAELGLASMFLQTHREIIITQASPV